MPEYKYECENCEKLYDVRHSIHDNPQIDCENCGGDMVRIPQAPQVNFSGPGFYSTDNTRQRKA